MKKTPIQQMIDWAKNDLEIFIEDSDEALRIFKAIEDKAAELLAEEVKMVERACIVMLNVRLHEPDACMETEFKKYWGSTCK